MKSAMGVRVQDVTVVAFFWIVGGSMESRVLWDAVPVAAKPRERYNGPELH